MTTHLLIGVLGTWMFCLVSGCSTPAPARTPRVVATSSESRAALKKNAHVTPRNLRQLERLLAILQGTRRQFGKEITMSEGLERDVPVTYDRLKGFREGLRSHGRVSFTDSGADPMRFATLTFYWDSVRHGLMEHKFREAPQGRKSFAKWLSTSVPSCHVYFDERSNEWRGPGVYIEVGDLNDGLFDFFAPYANSKIEYCGQPIIDPPER